MNKTAVVIPKNEYKEYQRWRELRRFIPVDQLWFWTRDWQRKEWEAEEDVKAGRLSGPFTSSRELVKSLKSKRR